MRTLWNYVRCIFRVALVIISLRSAALCRGEESRAPAKGWDRNFLENDPDLRERHFVLAILSSVNDRLIGYFAFRNRSAGPMLLHGRQTLDGDFWPIVKLQVGYGEDREWKTISPSPDTQSLIELKVQPNETVKTMVALDLFRPFLVKGGCGRVVLENGETAWFELSDLLAPK